MAGIALCGAHGVGKTYLAREINKTIGIPRITGVARYVAKRHGYSCVDEVMASDYRDIVEYQKDIMLEQIAREEALRVGFISERSVYDVMSYLMYYSRLKKGTYYTKEVEEILDKTIRKFNHRYGLLVYCPIPRQTVSLADGFRSTDKSFMHEVNRILANEFVVNVKGDVLVLGINRETWAEDVIAVYTGGNKVVRKADVRDEVQ